MNRVPVMLLVEDNDDHAELVVRSLDAARPGVRVFRVRNGDEALDYLHHRGAFAEPEASPTPNVVVLDLRMPRLNGFEFLRHVKSDDELCTIPVVVLTSSSEPADMVRAYRNHANGYLVKPFDVDALLEMVGSLRTFWIEHNRVPYASDSDPAPNTSSG